MLRVVQHDLAVRCCAIGRDQDLVADVVDRVEAVVRKLGDDGTKRLLAPAIVAYSQRVAAFAGILDLEKGETLILRRVDAGVIGWMLRIFVDEYVFALRPSELVVIDFLI